MRKKLSGLHFYNDEKAEMTVKYMYLCRWWVWSDVTLQGSEFIEKE